MTSSVRSGLRVGGWLVTTFLVVLGSRALAYALAPRPSQIGTRLEYAAGGPRLVVLAGLVLAIAAALSSAVIWLVAVGVAERVRLEPLVVVPSRISGPRLAAHALLLWCAGSLGFAALESYVHWRAGLGWHGIHCLVGPAHRNAIPILAALSLVASALLAAAAHLLAWMRRVVGALRRSPSGWRAEAGSASRTNALLPPRSRCGATRLGPRGPPVVISGLV